MKKIRKIILFLINNLLGLFNAEIVNKKKYIKYKKTCQSIASLYKYNNLKKEEIKNNISCVIFSMDRAIQLHALLSSINKKIDQTINITILYKTTSLKHWKSYEKLKKEFVGKNIKYIEQKSKTDFKPFLLAVLKKIATKKMFFLVDDIVITNQINIRDILKINSKKNILSLRLGKNIDYSYTHQKKQIQPIFLNSHYKNLIQWEFKKGKLAWGYQFSLDGHVFLTDEIAGMINSIEFDSPNSLELNLQIFSSLFSSRNGVCYEKSRLFNVPINKVQTDNNNYFGEVHQDLLLDKWNSGLRICYEDFYNYSNKSTHEEVKIRFAKR